MFPLGLQFINDHSIPMLAYCDLKKYGYEILKNLFPFYGSIETLAINFSLNIVSLLIY